MEDISLHVLDIVENSIRAGAAEVRIEVREDRNADLLTVEIRDDGEGMSDEMKQKALDPFYTSKENKRVGLGIPLLMQSACEGGGAFVIDSKPKGGTRITATFMLSHPDRKPLGDLDGTVRLLRFTHPEINFIYEYRKTIR
jgi:signal transduction histidine kinase